MNGSPWGLELQGFGPVGRLGLVPGSGPVLCKTVPFRLPEIGLGALARSKMSTRRPADKVVSTGCPDHKSLRTFTTWTLTQRFRGGQGRNSDPGPSEMSDGGPKRDPRR